MIGRLRTRYRREAFYPTLLGTVVNPFYFPRKHLLRHLRDLAPRTEGRLLDIGCGKKPYRELFATAEYVGLEIDTPENRASKNADCYYDGRTIPFPDGHFGTVFLSQVMEHVFEPDALLAEIRRVLAPGGKLLLTVPFAWDEHEQPWDYARYSSFGLRHLVGKHGFKVAEHRKSGNDASAVVQMAINYLFKTFVARGTLRFFVLTPLLIGPLNVLGLLASRLLPPNDDFYLDNILLAGRE